MGMDWTQVVIRDIEERLGTLNNDVDTKSGDTASYNFVVDEYDEFANEVKRWQNKHQILSAACAFVDDCFSGHYECWIVCGRNYE